MMPFKFKCRATDIEHSCRHKTNDEPDHPPNLLRSIASIIESTQLMPYEGTIKSSANSYQIDFDFDSSWIRSMNKIGWNTPSASNLGGGKKIPVKPDAILSKDNATLTVEIEKANKKTIWFDLIKIMMLTGQGIADFGILVVPRNYAHRNGIWDLFDDARYYRWCLAQYAKVEHSLLSRIAIIGYTQEVEISGSWMRLDRDKVNKIKNEARAYFWK